MIAILSNKVVVIDEIPHYQEESIILLPRSKALAITKKRGQGPYLQKEEDHTVVPLKEAVIQRVKVPIDQMIATIRTMIMAMKVTIHLKVHPVAMVSMPDTLIIKSAIILETTG
jgi:hypothetical protein